MVQPDVWTWPNLIECILLQGLDDIKSRVNDAIASVSCFKC
jgi:hypothetical protein